MGGFQNLGRVLYLSLTTSVYFSLTATVDTIFPELSDQKGYPYLGQIMVMITYFMQVVGTIYCQKYISLKRSGLSLFISGLLLLLTYVPALIINRCEDFLGICSYKYISIISFIGFSLQGLGLGAYYLLQSSYISACTKNQSGDLLNGLSFTIIGMTFLIGNLYSYPLIGYLGREKFFIVLAISQFCLNFLFLFLPNSQTQVKTLDEISYCRISDTNVEDDSQESSVVLVDPQVEQTDKTSPFKLMMYYLGSPSVQKLVPYFFMTGLVIGFQFGQFYQAITECLPKGLDQVTVNEQTFEVFIYFGVGELLSGPIIALLNGRVDLSSYLKLYTYLIGLTTIITALNVHFKSFELCLFIALCWGAIDNFGQTTSNMIVQKQWGENLSLFGIYLAFQNIGAIIYQIFAILFPYSLMIYGLSFILFIQILCVVNIHIFVTHHYKRNID